MTPAAACLLPPLAIAVALLADRLFGEPPARWHPVVWIGRYLGWAGRRLPDLPPRRALAGGLLAWWAGALPVVGLAVLLEVALHRWLLPQGGAGVAAAALATGLLLKPMLSWRLLREEVAAVDSALARGIDAGRDRIARLASRDTTRLQPAEVRETAIETLAENLNDSVVAPLLWFALAGLPGAVLFRYANTADAMWGYRGRWEWAGKFAARADDVLAWLPARLAARALLPRGLRWRLLAAQARRTPSPNGGWPMAAMALALGVRLRKPGVYALHAGAPEPGSAHVMQAIGHAGRALALCTGLLMALSAAVALARGIGA
ncbi:adenosylcobinamide-phosphate synthase CbiB [Aquincola tertiaricarbonis]|uniref:adenosylcobinamide-phosphate synthase CbiB n=1 Tax=Aquincola tertiaricarbonis TaxID=391953 RepID=UPI000615126B|nr:adenosylcobinamide-phosphate synthase CbiB [Aquincola tertiaricarbonis]